MSETVGEIATRIGLRRSKVANGEIPMDHRTLTDADLDALSDKVIEKFEKRFYTKLGQRVWGLAWVTIVGAILYWATFRR